MKTFGIVLLILGITMTVITGFTLVTKEEVLDVGKIEVTKEKKTPVYWSPITGGILLAVGAVILLSTGRKRI